jgi:hypothetical protein
MYLLQRHLLPFKAHFESSLVLAYAFPASVLEPFLTPGLVLDTYKGFGFLAIALVQTRNLRPAFLPSPMGISFYLSGYRIFTRYRTQAGLTLRGLRILRSDTSRSSMRLFGNLLTHYQYELSTWTVNRSEGLYDIRVSTPNCRADLHVVADVGPAEGRLPQGSPFETLQDARKFAGPLPFTFDYESETHSIIRVEGVRQRWNPRPVSVTVHQNTFLEREPFRDGPPVLANAFFLEDVPYAWRRGIREPLKGAAADRSIQLQ